MYPREEEPHHNSQTDTEYHISPGYSESLCWISVVFSLEKNSYIAALNEVPFWQFFLQIR